MLKKGINNDIIKKIEEKIKKQNLEETLKLVPVASPATHRQRYWESEGKRYFKVHMWDLNSLSSDELDKEIDSRIALAREYFDI